MSTRTDYAAFREQLIRALEQARKPNRTAAVPDLMALLAPRFTARDEFIALLREIRREARRHGEYNPISGRTRLPRGYQKIEALARHAITQLT